MRIFKNRGDIFFSKTNKEKSTEQKILLIALVIIVLFSLVFMICVGAKNDFSVKKFFEPENLSTTQAVEELSLIHIFCRTACRITLDYVNFTFFRVIAYAVCQLTRK